METDIIIKEKAVVSVDQAFKGNIQDQISIINNHGFVIIEPKFAETKCELSFVAFDARPSLLTGFRKTQLVAVLAALFTERALSVKFESAD